MRYVSLCFDNCPPESEMATTIARRIAIDAPITITCAVPVTVAWILCLVQLVRTGRRGAAVALALPLAALSLAALYVSTGGHLLPTTWAEHSSWDTTFVHSLELLLLWPLATFVATFAQRSR